MINGESYKVLVAEAGKLALENNRKETGVDQNLFERVFVVKLLMDKDDPKRVAGAVGFSVREHKIYVFKCKTALLATGGAVNVFRTRATAEGQGRLVSGLECRFQLRDGSGIRSGDDDDGKPVRPLTFQGRLRAGRSLVSAV